MICKWANFCNSNSYSKVQNNISYDFEKDTQRLLKEQILKHLVYIFRNKSHMNCTQVMLHEDFSWHNKYPSTNRHCYLSPTWNLHWNQGDSRIHFTSIFWVFFAIGPNLWVCARLGPPEEKFPTNNHVMLSLMKTHAPLWHRLGMNTWYTSWTGFWQAKQKHIAWGDLGPTVDGRNPAPVDMVYIPVFTGTFTFQVIVWDFFHQQYRLKKQLNTPLKIDMEHNHGDLEDSFPF